MIDNKKKGHRKGGEVRKMKGNIGQHGNNFIGMTVRKGNNLYTVIEQNGKTYETHFTLKNIETGEEVMCGRNKFTIPRK